MIDRLYYTDPYCRSFQATVTRSFERDGRPAVTLDRTAFYPTSGGQPFDVGLLGGARVVDIIDEDQVVHVLATPVAAGSMVACEIDWLRRFDHMQQHTGQHLLSAAFDRLFENQTIGFHMGSDVSTIDLAREAAPDRIDGAVRTANEVIWDDRPVSIRFVSREEAAALPLRKDPSREGLLRLIEIADFDLSACGGTHVSRTGAVGMVAVLDSERHRGGTRVTFVCGGRALAALDRFRDAVAGSVRLLSVLPYELPSAVEKVQAESKDLRKQVKDLQGKLALHEGGRLSAGADLVGGVRVAIRSVDGWDAAGLKTLAAAAVAAGRTCAVLLSSEPPLSLVIARSRDVPLDAQALLKVLVERFGGRGGGRSDMAQGGGLNAPSSDVESAARELIQAALRAG